MYRAHSDSNYHRVHSYIGLTSTSTSCSSSIECIHWSLKRSQIQYHHQKMQEQADAFVGFSIVSFFSLFIAGLQHREFATVMSLLLNVGLSTKRKQ